MRMKNENNNKILKFSIRKLSLGAAPVVIGALFFGSYVPSEALANENNSSVKYTYLAENELTESEKSLIKRSIPKDVKNNETYYMVYKKETQTSTKPTTELKELPNTGQSSLPVAGLGIGTAVLIVFLMSKKHRNKVLSVVLIGAMGQSIVMPYQSFAFENKELVRYNTQTTVANSSELANGVINIDGYRYVGYFTLSDLGLLPKQTQPKFEPTQPQPQPTPTPSVDFKTTPAEDPKVPVENKPEAQKPVVAKGTQESGKEGQALTQPALPEASVAVNGTQEPGKEGQALTQPALPEASVAVNGTLEPGKEGQALTQPPLPEATVAVNGTQEPGKEGQALTQPPLPEASKPEEKVDKTALKAQIDGALALIPADYSVASYDALKPILAAAQNVYTSDSVKQPEVDSETAKLKAAIDALSVDKTDLNKTIENAKSKTKEHYSNITWTNLQTVLAEAEKVTNNPAAKQSEVDYINEKLKAAIDKINKKIGWEKDNDGKWYYFKSDGFYGKRMD